MVRPVEVKPLPGYRIWIEYDDGESGEIDLSHLAGKGVFTAWDEPDHFDLTCSHCAVCSSNRAFESSLRGVVLHSPIVDDVAPQ